MVLVFPLVEAQLADLLKLQSVSWNPMRQDQFSMLGSGEFLSRDLGPELLEADVTTIQLLHSEAKAIMAKLRSLDGSNWAFYLYDPAAKYPPSDPTGSIFGAAAPVISAINVDRKQLTITGMPNNYVIKTGTMFHVDYGSPSRRALLTYVEDFTTTGVGATGEREVRPHLRPGIIATNPVIFMKPSAKVKLVPGTLNIRTTGKMTSQISFTARQTLQAG